MENVIIQDVIYFVFWFFIMIFVYKYYNFIIDNKWFSEFFKVKKSFDKRYYIQVFLEVQIDMLY